MKKLIIVRHCKSSWSDSTIKDFDRPLNKRGREDGQIMSNELSTKIKEIDILISSTSARTKLTSNYFINKIKIKEKYFKDELYHSSYQNIISIIKNIGQINKSIMLIGHNPGLTDLVNNLTKINLYNLPTTGIVIINLPITSWRKILTYNDKFDIDWIKFPKELKL